MKVLIADDDPVSTAIMTGRLKSWGLEVIAVPNGARAWSAIEQDPDIALAILDWMMPVIEGPELCRRIRRDERHAHLYLLLVTARDSRADIITGMDAGADDYLTKPFDADEFRVRLNAGLRVVTLQHRLAQRVKELEAAAASIGQLHGLLPICSYCKNVRTDDHYWQQVEDYVAEHSRLQFTHGICPGCYEAEISRM
jgi:DNA-binding response OmpR family regulator